MEKGVSVKKVSRKKKAANTKAKGKNVAEDPLVKAVKEAKKLQRKQRRSWKRRDGEQ